jgi:hypothetical protein
MHGGVHETELLYMNANAAILLRFMLTMETRPLSVQAEPAIFFGDVSNLASVSYSF